MASSDILWIPGILFFSLLVLMVLDPYIKKTKGGEGVYSVVIMAFLGIVTAMFIVIFLPKGGCGGGRSVTCVNEVEGYQGCGATEGFAATEDTAIDPASFTCPDGAKLYTDMQGNMNCCKGEINGKVCNGKTVCTFSGNIIRKYPSCIRPPRKIRWRGTVHPWVQQWMNSGNYKQRFDDVLRSIYKWFPTDEMKRNLTQSDVEAWTRFMHEEFNWLYSAGNEPLIAYQEEFMLLSDRYWALWGKSHVAPPSPLPLGNSSASCTK